jgi:hypothetical protein
MDDELFVGIHEPVDVRRNLLESSKEVVESLQKYEKLNIIRLKKLKYFDDMKKVMEEINFLIVKLKEKMPKNKLRKNVEVAKSNSSIPRTNEMSKIETELKSLEREFSKFKI